MCVKTNCEPRASVFQAERRATVLSLNTFLQGKVHGGKFFAENDFTNGMRTLMDCAFHQPAGSTAQRGLTQGLARGARRQPVRQGRRHVVQGAE